VVEPSLALAGSAPAGKGVSAATSASDATDFSARRRYYRGGGGAAAAAAFAGIVGTGLAIAATQNRGAYYGDSYDYYGGGPVYHGGGRRPLLRRIWQVECCHFPWPPAGRMVTFASRTDRPEPIDPPVAPRVAG